MTVAIAVAYVAVGLALLVPAGISNVRRHGHSRVQTFGAVVLFLPFWPAIAIAGLVSAFAQRRAGVR